MEVLATVILLGTGIIAILGALLASATISHINQEKTTAALATQKTGEELSAGFRSTQNATTGAITGVLNYSPCAVASGYPLSLPSDPTGAPAGRNFNNYTATVVDVDYLRSYDASGTPQFDENPVDGTNCHTNEQADRVVSGLQRITVVVKHNGKIIDTVVVYKRNQLCPTNFSNADQGPC